MKKRSVIYRVGQFAVVGLIVWLGWTTLVGSKPSLAEGPSKAVETIASQLGPQLVAALPADATLAIFPFKGDQTGAIGARVRSTLSGYGTLSIQGPTLLDRLSEGLGLRRGAPHSVAEAIVRGRNLNATHALFGVAASRVEGGIVKLSLHARLINVAEGRELDVGGVDAVAAAGGGGAESAEGGGDGPGWRLVASTGMDATGTMSLGADWLASARSIGLWALAVMSLPILSVGFLRLTVSRESNTANAVLLAGYLLASILLYLLVVGLRLTSVWSWLLAGVAVLLCGIYHFAVMRRVAKSAELT
jgi:hypothetical protein